MCWHSSCTINEDIKDLLIRLAHLHDLGKGTPAFQEYIANPEKYNGDPREKAHTPLSMLLTLVMAKNQSWDELETLILTASAVGHHGRLPTIPQRKIDGDCTPWDIDSFTGGEKAKLLKKQLRSLDLHALAQEAELHISGDRVMKQEPEKLLRELKRYLHNHVLRKFATLNIEQAVMFRLKTQLVFSMFLEADKALLAVSRPEVYLARKPRQWQSTWIDQRIGQPADTPTNTLRKQARKEVIHTTEWNKDKKIFSLIAPTGCGKTLLAATWALKTREMLAQEQQMTSKIIVVLPFLSVIDQTAKEYGKLLETGNCKSDGTWLLTSHSLSDRQYAKGLEDEDSRFFVDTWRSEIIITTYDQFLMSLMEPKVRYQMRFHNLCDALIIMDEVQSIPCKLWQPLDMIFRGLTELGNSRILLMSATLPPFVDSATPLVEDYYNLFAQFNRYVLSFKIQEKISMDDFSLSLSQSLYLWLKNGERVLITLNTRGSARKVRDSLEECWPGDYTDIPLFFISADVTPKDRLEMVNIIKKGEPCVVVSTQCIEAGVDIDMSLVIRDFGPMDSIVQIAGRCNREGLNARSIVEIVDLVNEDGRRYSEMIYDSTHLQVTRKVINTAIEIEEREVLQLTTKYFKELAAKKDTGTIHLQRFASWQEDSSVRELLRGKERLQYSFIVLTQDPKLRDDIDEAIKVEDRWQRREAIRKLSGRIAMVSVNIYAKPGFHPGQIADLYMNNWWFLRDGYYSSKSGLSLEGDTMIL